MHRIPPNLLQQVEALTVTHRPDEVVRIRNGKLVAGKFKGTPRQRLSSLLFKMLVPPCHWKKELFRERSTLFEETSKREEQVFADALVNKISNKTNTQDNLRDSLNIAECNALLAFSEVERKQFDTLVGQITDSMISTSKAAINGVDDAKKIAARAVNDQSLSHITQIKELRIEVNKILSKSKVDPQSIENLDQALDEQTIKLALYNQAKEYALGIYHSQAGNRSHSKEEAVEQAIAKLDTQYPSLADSIFITNELATYLVHFLSDIKINSVNPLLAIPLPHSKNE